MRDLLRRVTSRTMLAVVLAVCAAGLGVAALAWGRDNGSPAAPLSPVLGTPVLPATSSSTIVVAPTPIATAPGGHFPNSPSTVAEYPQQKAAPAMVTPLAPEPVATGEGRLAKLYATVDTGGWTVATVTGFPVSTKLPPGYFANFRIFNMLDGRQGYALMVTNYDLEVEKALARPEGSVAPPDRVGVTAQLYPGGSAPERGVFEAITDQLTITVSGAAGGSFEIIQHSVLHPQLGLPGEFVEGSTYAAIPGGRLLVVHASSDSPADDRLIRELIGVVASIVVR